MHTCFCLALLCAVIGYVQPTAAPIDIVLLLDSSDGHRSNYFEEEKAFVIDVIKQIYHVNNRIGLYTFGKRTHRQFNMNVYTDLEQMITAVNYMWYSTGIGDISSAIESVLKEGFTLSAGNRECVPNVLVILTHSGIRNSTWASELHAKLQASIIRTIIIKMGTHDFEENFINITEDAERLIYVNTFPALKALSTPLVQRIITDQPRSGCGQMTEWSDWTACSTSCNPGLQFRSRQCVKVLETDKECTGVLTDDAICQTEKCTVDGGWSFWSLWGGCSKSCDTGKQMRHRECTLPLPANGGLPCVGESAESRDCATWTCPDCQKSCPPGGILSPDCELCECSSVTLYGRIMNNMNRTVEGAEVYLESRRYTPIATTDSLGAFTAHGICIMNEQIYVEATTHAGLHVTPTEVNITHWTINSIIELYIPPVFRVQPEDKTRLVGQSFSLCCTAYGNPQPTAYKWIRNGTIIASETTGILTITSAQLSDSGVYKCSTETAGGVSQSDDADVKIIDSPHDSCGPPSSKIKQLPFGCYPSGGDPGISSINIGTCEKSSSCVKPELQDNGTCSDWWLPHCCDVKDTETIDITCDGFSYQTTRVLSCECIVCIIRTTISGRVIGKENGTEVPFQLGSVYYENERVAQTNMAGFFSFEISKGTKRVVLTFVDEYFKKFIETIKIVHPVEGIDNQVTIVIPIKPEPVIFNAHDGVEFLLGDDNEPTLGSLSIPNDALFKENGELYLGAAKATMHFVDPRNRDSIEASNGEFQSELPDGTDLPLETFGLVNIAFEDNEGNPLVINKPMKVLFDASLFNITVNADGETDLSLWNYDTNKGIWVESEKMKVEQVSPGRKLLATEISASFHPTNVPELDHHGTIIKRVYRGYRGNVDRPIYENVPVKDPNPLQGACYVSVSAYEDLSFQANYPHTKGSLEVVAFTKDINDKNYKGVARTMMQNGRACVKIFCDSIVYLSVEQNKERLCPGDHYLPFGYPIFPPNNSEIKFESRDFGNALRCSSPPYRPNTPCKGPVYQKRSASDCNGDDVYSNSFQFKFAPYVTRPPEMEYAVKPISVYDKLLSWYPVPAGSSTFRTCYIKVLIKINGAFDARIIARSKLDDFNGGLFGTSDVGPIHDPESGNTSIRAACFEFRCPGFVRNGTQFLYHLRTAVDVHLTTKEVKRCTLKTSSPDLTGVTAISHPTLGDVGFQLLIDPDRNYGPRYGIYVNDKPASEVQKFCYSGSDSGLNVNNIMRPTRNPAVEFDCV